MKKISLRRGLPRNVVVETEGNFHLATRVTSAAKALAEEKKINRRNK